MNLVNPKTISDQINRCYLDYDKGWPERVDKNIVHGFKYYVERLAGLKLDFTPELDPTGRYGYKLTKVEVVNDKKYAMFLMKYSA